MPTPINSRMPTVSIHTGTHGRSNEGLEAQGPHVGFQFPFPRTGAGPLETGSRARTIQTNLGILWYQKSKDKLGIQKT